MEVVVVVSESPPQATNTSAECVHCGYCWETESDLANVTCPSCQRKTPVDDS